MFKKLLLLLPLALLVIAACRTTLPPVPSESAAPEQQVLPAQVATKTPSPPPPKDTPNPDSLTSKFPPEFLNRDRSKGETLPNTRFGPQNKGAVIPFKGGKTIKLPDNVWLLGVGISECGAPAGVPCPSGSYVTFVTGKSLLEIKSALTVTNEGKLVSEVIAPGEEGVFESIKRQLQ